MSEALAELFETSDVKAFVKLFKEHQEAFGDSGSYLKEVVAYLPLRLYERYYDHGLPHSFLGLSAAAVSESLFPEERKWWPYVQQSWFAAQERKRSPFGLDAVKTLTEGSLKERLDRFEDAVIEQDVKRSLGLARGLFGAETDRRAFRDRSFQVAMADTAQGGLKFLYLAQCWRLAEIMAWAEPRRSERMLFPALHFLAVGPQEKELSRLADQSTSSGTLRILDNQGELPEERYAEWEQGLLFEEDPTVALKVLNEMSSGGVTWEAAQEALILAAAQALTNSQAGRWIRPARALLFSYLAREWARDAGPEVKIQALATSATLVNHASRRSREQAANRNLEGLARTLCPTDTFNTLRSLVSHSDPYASAETVGVIIGMGEAKEKELFENLAALAAKNDGQMGLGYDLLLVKALVDSYGKAHSGLRDRLLISCGFFLGRIQKSYELFSAYGV